MTNKEVIAIARLVTTEFPDPGTEVNTSFFGNPVWLFDAKQLYRFAELILSNFANES